MAQTSLLNSLSPQAQAEARLYRLKQKARRSPASLAHAIRADLARFNPAYVPHFDNMARTQIYYGGSGSGKSVFLAQRVVLDLLAGGRNYLVCRAEGKYNRASTYAEIKKVIADWELGDRFNVTVSTMTITCENGYQAIFVGLDDPQKLKSIIPQKGVITDIWIEEATQTNPDVVKELVKRQRGGDEEVPKRLTLSFNPIIRTHWIYQEYFAPLGWQDNQTKHQGEGLTILKTWYIHNRFLTAADVADLEAETDEYYYNVYTLGNWGVLGDVIFKNWRVEDLSDIRATFDNHRYGLDFGFSSDPAALVCAHYDATRKRVYIFDELYEWELTNDVLAERIRPKVGAALVTCDSSEPKSIAELGQHGIAAGGAKKGKDSVVYGVQWLQQQEIIIDQRCTNTQNEFGLYQWRKDRSGQSMRQPQDRNNHIIDALRYALEGEMGGGFKVW